MISGKRETVWVCHACGKIAKDPMEFSDPACGLNALECYKDKLKFKKNGRVWRVLKGGVVQSNY